MDVRILTPPPGPRAEAAIAAEAPHVSPSLIYCYPLVVKRASGCMVEDVDGNIYLDAQAGIAAASTGHAHPAVARAIAAQAENLIHICGTDFHYPVYGALCERLGTIAAAVNGNGRPWQVFLSNSGAEAVEGALKLARYHTKRSAIVAFRGGFHGRSFGALSLTASKAKYRKGFGPFLPGVHHATWGDAASLEREVFAPLVPPRDVAAIVVEPILGEGGYVLPPADFLPALRRICDEHGILLVFDEVQTGMGRTGRMLAAEHFGVVPDVFVLAKGLASGMPLGAIVAQKRVMTWPQGSHGSTCGGNPVCCAAALATLDLLEGGLVANSATMGTLLRDELAAALLGPGAPPSGVVDVRGLGLMIGVELATPEAADAVAQLCFTRGLLVLECGKKTIRLAPPLLLSRAQASTIVAMFSAACRDVAAGSGPAPPPHAGPA
jgi:4-aminobutyrate aminotransferase